MPTYEQFETALICALAEATDNLGASFVSLRDLAGAQNIYSERGWIGLAEQSLAGKGFIEIHDYILPGKQIVGITQAGREYVLEIIRKNSPNPEKPMRDVDLTRYDWFLLGVMFHASYENETEGNLSVESFQTWEPDSSPKKEIEERLEALEATGLVISQRINPFVSPSNDEEKIYRISTLGIYAFLKNLDEFHIQKHGLLGDIPEQLYETVDKFLDDYNNLLNAQILDESATTTIPASDRVVSLDHNSPAYQDAVRHLEDLKGAIEANNEYRISDLEDHERRLTDVETTLKILENKRVNVNAVRAVAFGTLVYLAEKFAEHPIGELAKAAWDGLKALLGIG